MRPSRFQLALAVAAALHGGIWLARAAVRQPTPEPTGTPLTYEREATVDIDTSQVPSATGGGAVAAASPRRSSASGTSRAQGELGTSRDETSATPSGSGEVAAPAPSSSGVLSVWNTDALAQRDLGVGDTRSFATPPPPISENEIVRDRIQRSLTDGLRDREVAAGGDPMSGPVVRALEDATTAGLAPVNGRATFDAVINAAGFIVSVGAVDTSAGNKADKGAWDDIAKASAASLQGRQLRKSKNGVIVRIEITSRNQLPSGSTPGFGADVLGLGGKKDGPSSGAHILPVGPVGSRPAELTLANGTADISDIGASAHRVIGAHVTAIRDL